MTLHRAGWVEAWMASSSIRAIPPRADPGPGTSTKPRVDESYSCVGSLPKVVGMNGFASSRLQMVVVVVLSRQNSHGNVTSRGCKLEAAALALAHALAPFSSCTGCTSTFLKGEYPKACTWEVAYLLGKH